MYSVCGRYNILLGRHQFRESSFKDLQSFSSFSGLRPNFTKCKIAGIGVLKRVNVALCGMKCLDLAIECIKVLGLHISYNRNLQNDKKNFVTP